MSNLYCDNYSTCNSYVLDLGTAERTETKARVRGWHIFTGTTIGGDPHRGVLCPTCLGPSRRGGSVPPKVLPGQEGLFVA